MASRWTSVAGRGWPLVVALSLAAATPASSAAQSTTSTAAAVAYPDPWLLPEVQQFLGGRGSQGLGTPHPAVPPTFAQFGRFVGVWRCETEVGKREGGWADDAPAVWVWKYQLGGFAIADLWVQSERHLPAYLSGLGRAYQLETMRVFEPSSSTWQTAWFSNGGGKTGTDFGTFVARQDGDTLVMLGESAFGRQRITFSAITERSFVWTSEYSKDDGKTWIALSRVRATRAG